MNCSIKNKRFQRQKDNQEYQRGIDTATDGMIIMLLYVLADKNKLDDNELAQVLNNITYVADSIDKGYITLQDLKDVLKEEHGITIE